MRSSSCGSECWRDVNHVWIRGGLNCAPSVPSLVFYLTLKKTDNADFAGLSLCIREETFPGGGGGGKGSLVGSVVLKPFNSDPV